jgi:trk system potassium uptake protein TrkH
VRRALALPSRYVTHPFRLAGELLAPPQLLTIGLLSYVVLGVLLLSLPWAQARHVGALDNLFTATSGMSTTGLTTVSVSDDYTFFGQLVVLCLFQFGGLGYMTLSSFVMLASGRTLDRARTGVLRTQFVLPAELEITRFVLHTVVFTAIIEAVGVAFLYVEFYMAGVSSPLWSAVFHCVSAFSTAGFSLNNNSFEDFRGNGLVCATLGVLCYLGAIGFIVIQDAWRTFRGHQPKITFTSKVILVVTAGVFLIGTPIMFFEDASLRALPPLQRLYAAAFQVMTASTTAGFNSVPIGRLSTASFALIIITMIIGASPSGTGGGLKTTTLSAMLGVVVSMLRARPAVRLLGREIPLPRVLTAAASASLYMTCLAVGVFLLCLVEPHSFVELVFEAASALGTVGLSLGITASLTAWGKLIITGLMFLGRVGPLTIGIALIRRAEYSAVRRPADLAV